MGLFTRNENNYHVIDNFSSVGKLYINKKVIEEIVVKAINSTKGALLDSNPYAIMVKFTQGGNLNINVTISIASGFYCADVITKVQETIDRNVLTLTEIKPNRINVNVAYIAK